MANKAEYVIEVSKAGTGAAQAAAEFRALDAVVAKTNNTLAAGTAASMATATNSAKAATASYRALQGTMTLIGMQTFPQLTLAANAASAAFQGVKASAAATGASLTATFSTLGLAAIGAVIHIKTLTSAFDALKASKQEFDSADAFKEQFLFLRDKLIPQIERAMKLGRVSRAEGIGLINSLNNASGNERRLETTRNAQKMLQGINAEDAKFEAKEKFDSFFKGAQAGLLEGAEKAKAELMAEIDKLVSEGTKLANDAGMSNQPVLDLANQLSEKGFADISEKYPQVMEEIKVVAKGLTELQLLGQQVAQNFAAGMSAALAQSFTEGGKALQAFFAQFMQQTAQMILQLLIMRALKSAFGGPLGMLAEGGMRFAAHGGLFPTYAANGLAGVQSVSSATYFPKFNVVAGEAGREMLTVLARPRFMEIGGMQAVVGSAGGNRLAITDADQLASRQNSGIIEIRVAMEDGLRADIVNNSVEGAVVRVTRDMKRHTPLRAAAREAST